MSVASPSENQTQPAFPRVEPAPLPPAVRFVEERPSLSIRDDNGTWHRCSVEQEAYLHSGICSNPRESHLGVYVRKRQNGRYLLGFDLWRVGVRLREEAIERFRSRWRKEWELLPKQIQRRLRFAGGRTAFELETTAECLDEWKRELELVLSDYNSYEHIERRTPDY
jgi:hypothetical protein